MCLDGEFLATVIKSLFHVLDLHAVQKRFAVCTGTLCTFCSIKQNVPIHFVRKSSVYLCTLLRILIRSTARRCECSIVDAVSRCSSSSICWTNGRSPDNASPRAGRPEICKERDRVVHHCREWRSSSGVATKSTLRSCLRNCGWWPRHRGRVDVWHRSRSSEGLCWLRVLPERRFSSLPVVRGDLAWWPWPWVSPRRPRAGPVAVEHGWRSPRERSEPVAGLNTLASAISVSKTNRIMRHARKSPAMLFFSLSNGFPRRRRLRSTYK